MHIFKNTNYNFLRWRWHAIALSWILILAGALAIWTKGIPLGVEFAGFTAQQQEVVAGAQPRMLELFVRLFGPYPFTGYGVVEQDGEVVLARTSPEDKLRVADVLKAAHAAPPASVTWYMMPLLPPGEML